MKVGLEGATGIAKCNKVDYNVQQKLKREKEIINSNGITNCDGTRQLIYTFQWQNLSCWKAFVER